MGYLRIWVHMIDCKILSRTTITATLIYKEVNFTLVHPAQLIFAALLRIAIWHKEGRRFELLREQWPPTSLANLRDQPLCHPSMCKARVPATTYCAAFAFYLAKPSMGIEPIA